MEANSWGVGRWSSVLIWNMWFMAGEGLFILS